MNPSHFEFTSSYLSHLAINCFTNKFYEFISPIVVTDQVNGKR